jgi:hypothetical protein
MPTVHYAISFGLQCRVKYQLKRVFRAASPSGVFDWQETPVATVIAYLENDFRGMFEQADLFVDPGRGHVAHRTLGTTHMHEFPSGVTNETIHLHYERARKRHDYLCGKLRKILRDRHPVLVVVAPNHGAPYPVDVPALREALRRFNPKGTFHFLVEPEAGALQGDWRGNNGAWDDILRPFTVPRLVRAGAQFRRYFRRPLSALPRFRQAPHS